jgi:hypothetical protein
VSAAPESTSPCFDVCREDFVDVGRGEVGKSDDPRYQALRVGADDKLGLAYRPERFGARSSVSPAAFDKDGALDIVANPHIGAQILEKISAGRYVP